MKSIAVDKTGGPDHAGLHGVCSRGILNRPTGRNKMTKSDLLDYSSRETQKSEERRLKAGRHGLSTLWKQLAEHLHPNPDNIRKQKDETNIQKEKTNAVHFDAPKPDLLINSIPKLIWTSAFAALYDPRSFAMPFSKSAAHIFPWGNLA